MNILGADHNPTNPLTLNNILLGVIIFLLLVIIGILICCTCCGR